MDYDQRESNFSKMAMLMVIKFWFGGLRDLKNKIANPPYILFIENS